MGEEQIFHSSSQHPAVIRRLGSRTLYCQKWQFWEPQLLSCDHSCPAGGDPPVRKKKLEPELIHFLC